MIRIFLAIFVLAASFAQSALACSVAPEHMYLDHDATIEDAEWIVIASPIRKFNAERGQAYEMRAIEYIKGSGPDEFTINNADQAAASGDSRVPAEKNYYGHSVSSFWELGGRFGYWADCRMHPGFLFSGHKYLIFGPLDYNVGFENIVDDGDLWLEYVRARVAGDEASKPFPKPPTDYFQSAKAIVHVHAKWEGNNANWDVAILKGDDAPYLKMAHVSPAAYFSQILDPECQTDNQKRVGHSDVEYLYVFEELPSENIRKSDPLTCNGGKNDRLSSGAAWAYAQFSITGSRIFNVEDGAIEYPADCHGVLKRVCASLGIRGKVKLADIRAMLAQD